MTRGRLPILRSLYHEFVSDFSFIFSPCRFLRFPILVLPRYDSSIQKSNHQSVIAVFIRNITGFILNRFVRLKIIPLDSIFIRGLKKDTC